MNKYFAGFILLLTIGIATALKPKPKLSVEGLWKVVEVQTVKPNGSFTSAFPKESEVIFAYNHYSFCWTSHSSTTHSWQMADSVKLARLNQTIVNTGTYELKDALLTTKATFALNPMFVDGLASFMCSMKGDTLVLTGQGVFSRDNIIHPIYAGGSHIVNKLVRIKYSK